MVFPVFRQNRHCVQTFGNIHQSSDTNASLSKDIAKGRCYHIGKATCEELMRMIAVKKVKFKIHNAYYDKDGISTTTLIFAANCYGGV